MTRFTRPRPSYSVVRAPGTVAPGSRSKPSGACANRRTLSRIRHSAEARDRADIEDQVDPRGRQGESVDQVQQ
ncbi:hypothetical protein ACFC01_53075, partial [Streptomyces mirabilis]|uniref:hypothetical protein n=1 Tax=Streptomyces mirabilis TaxID=68239 RepID=UPI0035DC658C